MCDSDCSSSATFDLLNTGNLIAMVWDSAQMKVGEAYANPEVSCGRVQVFRYSTIIQSSNHLLHIYLFSLGFIDFIPTFSITEPMISMQPVKLLRLFSTKWLALSTWKWHEATISLLSSWCSYGLAQSPCSPAWCSQAWRFVKQIWVMGRLLVEFLLEKFVSKFLVLFSSATCIAGADSWNRVWTILFFKALKSSWKSCPSERPIVVMPAWDSGNSIGSIAVPKVSAAREEEHTVSIVGHAWKA